VIQYLNQQKVVQRPLSASFNWRNHKLVLGINQYLLKKLLYKDVVYTIVSSFEIKMRESLHENFVAGGVILLNCPKGQLHNLSFHCWGNHGLVRLVKSRKI